MEKEWYKINSFNGSQANAFEELVCQLAMAEKDIGLHAFERVGTPDGGVECYWQLKSGAEWGWQAKYYENLNASEWGSIKKSLWDAVNTHIHLTRYYICIPHNLSDGRRGRKTQKSSWDYYRASWTSELSANGREVELFLWNSSTLFSKLAIPTNLGIKYFFFQDIDIKEERLFLELDVAIANLGPKYNRDLNFKLDSLPMAFDALSRNVKFREAFKDRLDKLIKELNNVINDSLHFKEANDVNEALKSQSDKLVKLFHDTDFSPTRLIPVEHYDTAIMETVKLTEQLKNVYNKIEQKRQKEIKKGNLTETSIDKPRNSLSKLHDEKMRIYDFRNEAEEMRYYLKGPIIRAANEGILFLKGNPGAGKSHLLADIAMDRKQSKIPSILLLGEHFSNQLPKISIQQALSPTHPLNEYLKALESVAKAKQERVLFMIDALNEGWGKYIWKNSLAGLVEEFKQYKWIGFAFSYRTTFEKIIIPENLSLPIFIHNGFEGREYEATKGFFEYYKIQQPAIPILNPEFSNPLFLKTFCLTLNKSGKTTIPEGYEGISKILEEYLIAVNKNIGERLSFNHSQLNLIQNAVDELVKHQIDSGDQIIPWDTAFQLVEPFLRKYTCHAGFLDEIVREGLLIEDFHDSNRSQKNGQHGVIFNYERFNEHLKALFLIKKFASVTALKKAFATNGILRVYFIDKYGFKSVNCGLLNAMAVIIPEMFGVELYEVFKVRNEETNDNIYSAFLQSLIWRKHNSVKSTTWKYITSHINSQGFKLRNFFDAIFLSAASPNSYYNADFIHRFLKDRSVAERDHLWSIQIDSLWKWNSNNAIKRIIDWSWTDEEKSYISDKSIVLLGKAMAWMFTNSNRQIRDTATKALVALFIDRVHLLKDFILEFALVNDPYVLERVVAGSYGAICHSKDLSDSSQLAQFVYDQFFSQRKPPVNILTRDYLKGIIEVVIARGGTIRYEEKNINPPFDTSFPTDIPGDDWIDSIRINRDRKYTDGERGQSSIVDSVLSDDFARYILGTNHGSSIPFSNYPIASRDAFEKLKKQLRGNNREMLDTYVNAYVINRNNHNIKRSKAFTKNEIKIIDLETVNEVATSALTHLMENLKSEQLKLLHVAKPFITDGFDTSNFNRKLFPVKLVQHYILKKVFDLGWDIKLFGDYDGNVDEGFRRADKPERIGKKYQWIAYHEIMALLSDNYDFFEPYGGDNLPYMGGWQHYLRDIDPTCIIRINDTEREESQYYWWKKEHYNNWNESRETWLKRFDDMPNLEKIITVQDDKGDDWYLLHDRIIWKSPKIVGKDRYKADHRDVWIDVTGYLVKKKDKALLLKRGKEKIFWSGSELFEPRSYYNLFLGEWYSSDAYHYMTQSAFDQYPFQKFPLTKKHVGIIPTVEEYSFSSEYDLSGNKVRLQRPSKYLFTLLDGRYGRNEACIYDRKGDIIAMDAAAYKGQAGNGLLIKKKVLDACLQQNDLELIWAFYGEKEDIGANVSYVYRMLYSGFMVVENGKFKMTHYCKHP